MKSLEIEVLRTAESRYYGSRLNIFFARVDDWAEHCNEVRRQCLCWDARRQQSHAEKETSFRRERYSAMHNFQGVYVLDCQVKMLSSSSEYCYNQLSFLDSLVKVWFTGFSRSQFVVHSPCPDHFWVLCGLALAIFLWRVIGLSFLGSITSTLFVLSNFPG